MNNNNNIQLQERINNTILTTKRGNELFEHNNKTYYSNKKNRYSNGAPMSENFVCSNKEKGCKGTCLRKFTYPEFQYALFRSYDEATLEELGHPTIEMKLKNAHNQYCSTTVTSL